MAVKTAWTDANDDYPEKLPESSQAAPEVEEGEVPASPSWFEFTQNTTCHGVKYMFDQHSWIRRIFWFLAIAGSMTFFMLQVGFRIQHYFDYQTVTSVKVVTATGSLQFPAVSLCNLNQFRISVAYKIGLYDYFNEQLRTRNVRLEHDSLANIKNTTQTVHELGHQLEHIVDSCTWNGAPCDLQKDFKSQLLDIGLCHTFNFDPSDVKSVRQEGVNGGLKLLLNIEQYEHMRGLNLDSGVKFLLHDSNSVASLRNLGFVATPGQHTFVSIKMSKMLGQPPPWGNCSVGGLSVADCKHQCFADDFLAHCHCADTSMHDRHTQSAECDLSTKLTCGCDKHNTDSSACGAQCSCSRPCTETIYRPTLSSSTLSSINLDMFALIDPEVHNRTNQIFLEASEIRLKLSAEYNTTIAQPARNVLESMATISEVHNHYRGDGNASYLSLLVPLSEGFYHSTADFDPTVRLQAQRDAASGNECDRHLEDVSVYLDDVIRFGYRVILLQRMLNASGDNCSTSDAYRDVFDVIVNGTRNPGTCDDALEAGGLFDSYCSPRMCAPTRAWEKQELSPCDPQVALCLCCLAGSIRADADDHQAEVTNLRVHLTNSYDLYGNMRLNKHIPWYALEDEACKAQVDFFTEDTLILPTILSQIRSLAADNITRQTYETMVDTVYTTIGTQLEIYINSLLKINMEYSCCWQEKLLSFWMEQNTVFGYEPAQSVIYEKSVYDEAVYRFQSMAIADFASEMQAVEASGLDRALLALEEHVSRLQRYLTELPLDMGDTHLTTRDLAAGFQGPGVYRGTSTLVAEVNRLLEGLIKIYRVLGRFQENMEPFLILSLSAKIIPLIASSPVESKLYAFLQEPETAQLLRVFMIDKCQNISAEHLTEDEIDLFLKMSCVFYNLLADDISVLGTAAKDFDINLDTLLESLANHHAFTEMSEDFYMKNFMQVDLYYEDLEYAVTEEQKAFVLGSLFSEIGGFLGLLLGASVLTLCELLDYLMIKCCKKIKTVSPSPTESQTTDEFCE